jgi:hypothetical protein
VTLLAAAAVAAGAGLGAAEQVIRAGLQRLGAGVLEDLLAADPGYAGPRVPCGRGQQTAPAEIGPQFATRVLPEWS